MYYRKPQQDLEELKQTLQGASEKLKAQKEVAVKRTQFEYASDIRLIEKRLEVFIESLQGLEKEFC